MLAAPGPGEPDQLTVKLVLLVADVGVVIVLVGRPTSDVVVWAAAGVGWTRPRLLVATL